VKPPAEVIEEPPDAERPVGRLRLVAAAACGVLCPWMLWTSRGAPAAWLVSAAALAAMLFWWRSFVRIERRAGAGRRLVLDAEGLRLEGPAGFAARWDALERVELDHDRLVLRFVTRAGESHELEPPLGGLGLDALAVRIERARRAGVGGRELPGAFRGDPASP
jgi:hypothetical protein